MQHIFFNVTGVVELVVTACAKGVCVYSGYLTYDKERRNTVTPTLHQHLLKLAAADSGAKLRQNLNPGPNMYHTL